MHDLFALLNVNGKPEARKVRPRITTETNVDMWGWTTIVYENGRPGYWGKPAMTRQESRRSALFAVRWLGFPD